MSTLFPEGIGIGWLGHAFMDVGGPENSFLIDPFFETNPAFPKSERERIMRPGNYAAILLTHPHGDHIEGVFPLLKNDPELKIVCQFEVALYLAQYGIQQTQLLGMNTGGTTTFGSTRITMVPAVHTSSISDKNGTRALGVAVGYVIRFSNGFTVYNTGDTALTSDFQIIADLYKPDLVILPIGDFYTMGPEQAAYALKLLHPKFALPCHYGTWDGKPPGRPETLEKELEQYHLNTQVLKPKPGEWLN